jgi:hypothetical protein
VGRPSLPLACSGARPLPQLPLDPDCYFGTANVVVHRRGDQRTKGVLFTVECAVVPGSGRITVTGDPEGRLRDKGVLAVGWMFS